MAISQKSELEKRSGKKKLRRRTQGGVRDLLVKNGNL